jgi:hypothetical protein
LLLNGKILSQSLSLSFVCLSYGEFFIALNLQILQSPVIPQPNLSRTRPVKSIDVMNQINYSRGRLIPLRVRLGKHLLAPPQYLQSVQ